MNAVLKKMKLLKILQTGALDYCVGFNSATIVWCSVSLPKHYFRILSLCLTCPNWVVILYK